MLSLFKKKPHSALIEKPILAQCFVSIVVPVRDEAENLPKTLASFLNQTDLISSPLDPAIFEVIVLVNNCCDNSAEIVEKWQKTNQKFNFHFAEINLPDENANIGFVRRLLMNEACSRLKSNKYRSGIIATTDGDTRVACDWITNSVNEIRNGADAIGGRILIDENEFKSLGKKAENFHLLDEEYRLLAAEIEDFYDRIPHDSLPRHHQHFNGSFAVTTDAFERAGGIPNVKFLEDVAFYNALSRIDAKFRHSSNVKVFTSARNQGRTELGLSTQLNEWEIMGRNGDLYLVESAQTIEKRFTSRRKLRKLWQAVKSETEFDFTEISTLAENLLISNINLLIALKKSETFGILMEKITDEQNTNNKWKQENSLVPVQKAILDLRKNLKNCALQTKARNKTA
ncbi:MAG: glycosyltransferase family A protein [Acidobacteriota bacterium]